MVSLKLWLHCVMSMGYGVVALGQRLAVYSTGLSATALCMSLVYSSWLYFGDAGQQHKNTSKTGDCACMAAGVCSAFLPLAGLGSTTVQQFCAQGCVC
jgi:hypothetical protein